MMTPTTAQKSQTTSPLTTPRQPRRLSPEFAELLHMLSSIDNTSGTTKPSPGKD